MKEDKYTAVVCPFDSASVELAISVNVVTREVGLPFYSPNSTGLHGFFFADLGKEKFEYSYVKKSKVEGQADEQIMSATEGSRTLKEFFDEFTDPKKKVSWKKREVSKNHKLVLLSLMAQYLKHVSGAQDSSSLPALNDFLKTKEGLSQHV